MSHPQRTLVLPVAAGSLIFAVVYSLLHYLLVLRWQWIEPPEISVDLLGPGLFGLVFGYFFIAPRTACLKVDERRKAGCAMLVALLAAAPSIFAQHHVREASAELARVADPEALIAAKPVRYYEIGSYFIDRRACASHRWVTTEGRSGSSLSLTAYYACPLRASPRASGPAAVWFGQRYARSIGNGVTDQGDKQRQQIDGFFAETDRRFQEDDLSGVRHFKRLGNEQDRDRFQFTLRRSRAAGMTPVRIVLTGERTPYQPYGGGALGWAIGVWLVLALGSAGLLRAIGHDEPALRAFGERRRQQTLGETLRTRVVRPLGILVPSRQRWATSLLLDANILVFLAMIAVGTDPFAPMADTLARWGGLRRDLVLGGAWWRLFSSQFVHAGVLHLAMNMFTLGLAGFLLELVLVRRGAFIVLAYLAGGLVGGLASLGDGAVVVGASGAIFALLGIHVGAFLRPSVRRSLGYMGLVTALIYFALDLLLGRRLGFAWRAHVAGFVAGAVMGIVLPYRIDGEAKEETPGT